MTNVRQDHAVVINPAKIMLPVAGAKGDKIQIGRCIIIERQSVLLLYFEIHLDKNVIGDHVSRTTARAYIDFLSK